MLAAAVLLLLGVQTAAAQYNEDREETRSYPYGFIGIQGGGQAILNGYKVTDVVTPVGAVQGGAWFSPALGARLQVNGWKSKEGVKYFAVDADGNAAKTNMGTYKFQYFAAGIDLMINLTNAFSKTDDHWFNVILLGGLGINKAWNQNYKTLTADDGTAYWDDTSTAGVTEIYSRIHNHVAFQTRVGLMLDFDIASHWSINLEADFNHIGSRGYAYGYNGAKDWQGMALIGVTYKFSGKKKKVEEPAPLPPPPPAPVPKPEPAPEPKPEPKPEPAPVKQLETCTFNVFYDINQTTPNSDGAEGLANAGEWLKAHPTAVASIKGYADKDTGTPAINAKLAEERAQNVAETLTSDYGIDASRLTVSSYGDTEQPYSLNEKNRVTIVLAEEK